MARDQQLKQSRDTEIRAYYNSLRNQKEFGVVKFTSNWCLQKTSKKFFLTVSTCEKIIFTSNT